MYEYYRIIFQTTSAGTCYISELYFLDELDIDLIVDISGAPIEYNTAYSSNVSNMVDRNNATYYSSTPNSGLLFYGFRFNTPVNVDKVKFRFYVNPVSSQRAIIETSSDGTNWQWYGQIVDYKNSGYFNHSVDYTYVIDKITPYYYDNKDILYSFDYGPLRGIDDSTDRQKVNVAYSGFKSIEGKTTKKHSPKNIPVSRRCLLFNQTSNILVSDLWSDENGDFEFKGLIDGNYYVVSFDYTKEFNGEVITDLVPTSKEIEFNNSGG